MSRNRPVATALLLLTMMSAVTAQPAVAALEPAACAQDVALFMTPDGARAVRVEIADDPQERERIDTAHLGVKTPRDPGNAQILLPSALLVTP